MSLGHILDKVRFNTPVFIGKYVINAIGIFFSVRITKEENATIVSIPQTRTWKRFEVQRH